jgi:hypothetical protein
MPLHHLRRRAIPPALCVLLLLVGATTSQGDPTLKFDPTDWHGYVQMLTWAQTPETHRILREINDGPRDLARARVAAKRAGIPLTIADLQQPMPPVDENAAPIYVHAAILQQQYYRAVDSQAADLRRRHDLTPLLRFNYYVERLAWYRSYTQQQIALIRAGTTRQQPIDDALCQAALRPYCIFTKNDINILNKPIYINATFREFERRLDQRSFLQAHDGKYADAIATAKSGLVMARHVQSLPSFTSILAGSLENGGLRSICNILHMAGPNKEALAAIDAVLLQDFTAPALRSAAIYDVPTDLEFLEAARKEGPDALATLYSNQAASVTRNRYSVEDLRLYSRLIDALEAAGINMSIEYSPHADDDCSSKLALIHRLNSALIDPNADPIEQQTRQRLQYCLDIFDYEKLQAIAGRAVLLAADKALRIKATTGQYPNSLPGNYMDAFAHKRLSYARQGSDGFVIQTITPNMVYYDGGTRMSPESAIKFEFPGPKPLPEYDGPWPPPVPGPPLPASYYDGFGY